MTSEEKSAGPPKTPQSSSGSEPEKQEQPQENPQAKEQNEDIGRKKSLKKRFSKSKQEPAGGYDSTPIPDAPPGWTVKITFIKATNLPMADLNSLSSDPYVLAQLNTSLPQRHKEDPPLRFRTHTVRRQTEPVWNSEWIVANVPSSGFKLKARLYDEDPADHDDRLGNVHINVDGSGLNWSEYHTEQAYKIRKRMGSKRAYVIRAVATCVGIAHHMHGELHVRIEVLGRTKDQNGGRCYTLGPGWWTKHYSPMLGRITGLKEDKETKPEEENGDVNEKQNQRPGSGKSDEKSKKQKAQRYNFQANQMQFAGPVPAELYHRYVEFKPFIRGMFNHSGLRGYLLNKALHHQHARVYNYDRSTVWGYLPPDDPTAVTKRFLELVHYAKGGRIFTYVLDLDGKIRFTETGKEFGIDMLSKHSMHSDVSFYIAFSGEFFVRRHHKSHHTGKPSSSSRRRHSRSPDPQRAVIGGDATQDETEEQQKEGGQVQPETPVAHETAQEDVPTDPDCYELVIDNDSGTYRPAAHLLPLLRTFLQRSLPGLHVRVLDCQKDEEKMKKLKDEQRERKKKEAGGQTLVFTQRSRSSSFASSVSSSDEEALDNIAEGDGSRRFRKTVVKDAQWRAGARVRHWKEWDPRRERPGGTGGEDGENGKGGDVGEQGPEEGRIVEERGRGDGEKEIVTEEKVPKKQEGKGEDGGEKSTAEQVKDEERSRDRSGTVTNQGQAIGRADRDPEGHIVGNEDDKPDQAKA